MIYYHEHQVLGPKSIYVVGLFAEAPQLAHRSHTTTTYGSSALTFAQSESIFELEAAEIDRGVGLGLYSEAQAQVLLTWASERHQARLRAIQAGRGLL